VGNLCDPFSPLRRKTILCDFMRDFVEILRSFVCIQGARISRVRHYKEVFIIHSPIHQNENPQHILKQTVKIDPGSLKAKKKQGAETFHGIVINCATNCNLLELWTDHCLATGGGCGVTFHLLLCQSFFGNLLVTDQISKTNQSLSPPQGEWVNINENYPQKNPEPAAPLDFFTSPFSLDLPFHFGAFPLLSNILFSQSSSFIHFFPLVCLSPHLLSFDAVSFLMRQSVERIKCDFRFWVANPIATAP